MSNTENLGLKIPTLAEKNIHTTYVNNNDIIDEAYGQYLEDKETAQENIAMIETPVAQTNHTAGSYFMLDNVLHKATSNIASGEDIVSGSNATPITIEQALSALNSSVSDIQDSISIITASRRVATTTTVTQVGPSLVVPSKTIAFVKAEYEYNYARPTCVAIDSRSDVLSVRAICVAENSKNNVCATTGIYVNDTDTSATLYGWGSSATENSGGNTFRLTAVLFKMLS